MKYVRDIKRGDGKIIPVEVPETPEEAAEIARQKASGEIGWEESFGDFGRPNPYAAQRAEPAQLQSALAARAKRRK